MADNVQETVTIESLSVPGTKTATVTSSACDTQGYLGTEFVVYYGASGDTLGGTVYWTATLKECATASGTFTTVADDDVVGNTPTANSFGLVNASGEDSALYGLVYNGSLRYVKVVVTPTGVHSNGTPIGVFAVKKLPRTVTSEQAVNP